VDVVLSRLGKRRASALSVPHFATAAMCLEGTSYVAVLPKRMAERLARSMQLRTCRPPLALPAVTIMQVWHQRSDGDPATVMLRRVIREVGAISRGERHHAP
jgi:DNA-binding transcriptional LysR family regulator